MVIDLIFKGKTGKIDFRFLELLLSNAKNAYFNYPLNHAISPISEVYAAVADNDYVDFVIIKEFLVINRKDVPKVFINMGRNFDDIDILFFFDINDINEPSLKMNFDYLKIWAHTFQAQFHFDQFVCQMDNADDKEYYFDSKGYGQLYHDLSS